MPEHRASRKKARRQLSSVANNLGQSLTSRTRHSFLPAWTCCQNFVDPLSTCGPPPLAEKEMKSEGPYAVATASRAAKGGTSMLSSKSGQYCKGPVEDRGVFLLRVNELGDGRLITFVHGGPGRRVFVSSSRSHLFCTAAVRDEIQT